MMHSILKLYLKFQINAEITLVNHKKKKDDLPVGSIPCSSLITSQNLAPIWLPHYRSNRTNKATKKELEINPTIK